MMKKVLFLLLFIHIYTFDFSQKNDYNWIIGSLGYEVYDSITNNWFGINHFDFNGDTLVINRDSSYMNFDWTNSAFSDDNGHLLFYTNGSSIANKYHEKIENSDTLNPSYYSLVQAPDVLDGGYRAMQGTLVLPSFGNDSVFYLFHSTIDTAFIIDSKYYYKYLKLTTIDIAANAGHGKVISKNQKIWNGINYMGNITACKHANGRDWWILEGHRGDNCYSRSLFSPTGISSEEIQCIGNIQDSVSIYSNLFTPDGSKYIVSGAYNTGVYIYDFDRCSGLLSNEKHIDFPYLADSFWVLFSAVSANSRYLYVTTVKRLYQFDLWASDIAASRILIAIPDTAIPDDIIFRSLISIGQISLAPNGKIYIGADQVSVQSYFHIIDNPNFGGVNCQYKPYGLKLKAIIGFRKGFSNNPNYRLGRLLGSPCDTLTGIESQRGTTLLKSIQIYPNPSTEYIRVDYGNIEWNSSTEPILSIYNMLGNEVYSSSLPAYSGIQDIDIKGLSSGMYLIQIRKDAKLLATGKFVKE